MVTSRPQRLPWSTPSPSAFYGAMYAVEGREGRDGRGIKGSTSVSDTLPATLHTRQCSESEYDL